MREAFGGSILFYILITFLIAYVFFMSFVMNYASAYRASNYVVSKFEEYEGNVSLNDMNEKVREAYKYSNGFEVSCCDNLKGSVFKFKASVDFELPLVKLNFKIPLKTETKTIYGVRCSDVNYISNCE